MFVPLAQTALLFVLLGGLLEASRPPSQEPAPDCTAWQECRQAAADALAAGQYETGHDLAWRAVQKGPKNAPELLFLLARAQSLSGRAEDALVMLDRLADSGVAVGAINDEEFRRVRERPGWPATEARLTGAAVPTPAAAAAASGGTSGAAPTPSPSSVRAAESAAASAPVVQEAARFTTQRFAAGGLAYDAVSGRFVFGDLLGRKLIVAQDGVDHAVDYVRAESAGFYQVTSLTIDVPRGDLWVVSAEGEGGAAAVHKVQLISGRPLRKFDIPAELQPVQLVDVAVSAAGAVIALDAVSGHLFRLLPGAEHVQSLLRVKPAGAASIAMGRDEQVVYLAHRDGVSRIDLGSQRVTALGAPKAVELGGFERIRWHRDGLVGIQKSADGSRRVVRLQLNAAGRGVVAATVIQASMPAGPGAVFATVSDDQFSYLVSGAAASAPPGDAGERAEVVVYRIALR